MKEDGSAFKWFCVGCRESVENLLKEMKKLKEQMEIKIKDLGQKLDTIGEIVEGIKKESMSVVDLEEVRGELKSLRGEVASKKEFLEFGEGVDKMRKEVVVKEELDEVTKMVMRLNNGQA